MSSLSISRTIYDPSKKDFITSTPDAKAMPNIKEWINQHNPVIYWYILRLDNPPDSDITQWAVELYAHQALTITEAYIDGSDHRFELRKERHDPWTEKYVLSIPRQIGIPIVGRGTRRIFFKVDIDCKEGLMHEYGISGKFIAHGMEPIEIQEKTFQYSCKVGEFRQIFDHNPDEASMYAEKRLTGKYSTDDIHVFTNSFRMIHELSNYCHSVSLQKDDLLSRLQVLNTSFDKIPQIGCERISPLIQNEIRELDLIVDKEEISKRLIRLCNELVELLHIEVRSEDVKETVLYTPPSKSEISVKQSKSINKHRVECPTCRNLITESNKSLICTDCGTQFCTTCEEWFREERKRGEGPLCRDCHIAELERLREVTEHKAQMEHERDERLRWEEEENRLKEEKRKKGKEEIERKKREQEQEKLIKHGNSIGMKFTHIPAGEFMMGSKEDGTEIPVHKVTINKPFYLGTYPVTQREWKAIVSNNPSNFKGDDLPVEQVSWDDVQEFINKLNKKEGTDKYRLPSEAEWEYAARSGTTTKYCFGDDESRLGDYAWYNDNSGGQTHPVGQKKSNGRGLYDMYGNVLEWIQDEWHDDYKSAPRDGSAWENGNTPRRVLRGGGWTYRAGICRSAYRLNRGPGISDNNLGVRLLKEL